LFKAIEQSPNLRSELADSLAAQIESGQLKPGQRLPTEQAIMTATGVSRTVVREALATLRAKGLIATRQGYGAVVTNAPKPPSFSIVPDDLESIDEVLHVLELRLGVELEAAAFAAVRRSEEDIAQMQQRLDAIDAAIKGGGYGAEEDFAFHRSLLTATRNPYYTRLFDAFESAMIPRQWARLDLLSAEERETHTARMTREHYAIFDAIRERDPAAASSSMRDHLTESLRRFQQLKDSTLQDG
jgi:GntR family transcriptional repressor for pyruvate dehydrogenase complex